MVDLDWWFIETTPPNLWMQSLIWAFESGLSRGASSVPGEFGYLIIAEWWGFG
jgi:hypothetical protein